MRNENYTIISNVSSGLNSSYVIVMGYCVAVAVMFCTLWGLAASYAEDAGQGQYSDVVFEGVDNEQEIANEISTIRANSEALQKDYDALKKRLAAIESNTDSNINTNTNTSDESEQNESSQANSDGTTGGGGGDGEQNANTDGGSGDNDGASDEEQMYTWAYKMMKKLNNDSSQDEMMNVIDAFSSFIKQNPDSVLVSNAYYWTGKIYDKFGDSNSAALSYMQGYRSDTTGEKAQYNLVYLANAFVKLGKQNEACAVLKKLHTEFGGNIDSGLSSVVSNISNINCHEDQSEGVEAA